MLRQHCEMGLVLPNPGEHDYTASFNLMGKPGGAREEEQHGFLGTKEAKTAGILSHGSIAAASSATL